MNVKLLEDLLDSFNKTTFDRGMQYYYDNSVFSLEFIENSQTWKSKVSGNINYTVTISLNGDYTCTCKAYEKYDECKHIVATLLEIEDRLEVDEFPDLDYRSTYEISENLIQGLSPLALSYPDIEEDVNNKTPIQMQFQLNLHLARWSDNYFSVSLKVGKERLYVVKDIYEFLQTMDNGEEIYFSKNFTYDPLKHYFSNEDQEVLEMLYDIWRSEEFIKGINRYYVPSANIKEIRIPPVFTSRLLELLKKCDFLFMNNGNKYSEIVIEREKKPLHFQIKSVGEEILLDTQLLSSFNYLPDYHIGVIGNQFYPLYEENELILSQLLGLVDPQEDHLIPIEKENVDKFITHVVPSLKKVGEVIIEDTIVEQLLQLPLEIKIFLDFEDGLLTFRSELHYGEHVFNPFEIDNETLEINGINIIRDIEKEMKFKEMLRQSRLCTNGKLIFISDDDDIYHFLFTLLPKYKKFASLYLTDSVKNILHQQKLEFTFNVHYKEEQSLLDIEFELTGIDPIDVQNVIASIKEKKRYHHLSNGTFLSLDEDLSRLEEMYEQLNELGKIKGNKLTVPSYRAMQVDSLLNEKVVDKKTFNEGFTQLIHQFKNPESFPITVPTALKAELRDYQLFGYKWLKTLSKFGFGGILADDMGLGKTLQSIVFLLSERIENPSSKPALVVSPSSLVYNWKYEIERFAPSLKIAVVSGSKEERKEVLTSKEDVDVFITSYPLMRQDQTEWKNREFSILLLDEAQAIKNDTTKIAKTIKSIQASRKFALSGTPIENSLSELWSIFDCILPGFFPTKKKFQSLSNEKIAKLTKPFILRRLKTDVLHELPEKIESVQLSELTKEQKKLYLAYLEKIRGETNDALSTEGFQKSRIKILAGLTRLRQICCHPSLFLENYEGDSNKLNQLMEVVQTSIENGQRILVFSQFSSMLQIIKAELDRSGIQSFYLDGSTPSKDRVEMANAFNNGERNIFLISLKAGGTGLNLTGADTVILYDLWWNPAVEEQATARAHRMGQKKVVQVFRLIAEGTIEEKIYKLQQKKKELVNAIIQPGEANFSSLTEEEILELLS